MAEESNSIEKEQVYAIRGSKTRVNELYIDIKLEREGLLFLVMEDQELHEVPDTDLKVFVMDTTDKANPTYNAAQKSFTFNRAWLKRRLLEKDVEHWEIAEDHMLETEKYKGMKITASIQL